MEYACKELKDESGFGLAVCDVNTDEAEEVKKLRRAKKYGAKRAYVISDMEFYVRLVVRKKYHYSFYFVKTVG